MILYECSKFIFFYIFIIFEKLKQMQMKKMYPWNHEVEF